MTQVVEAEVPGKTHLMYGLLKVPAYPVIAERGPTTPDEDEVVWGAVLKLLKQQRTKPVGKGQPPPRRVGLELRRFQVTSGLDQLILDHDLALESEPLTPNGAQLAPA